MAFGKDFTATTISTAAKSPAQTAVVAEDSGNDIVRIEVHATINSAVRLLHRIKLTLEQSATNSPQQRYRVDWLTFESSADQTYTPGSVVTPFTDAEADTSTLLCYTPWQNQETIWDTAGG